MKTLEDPHHLTNSQSDMPIIYVTMWIILKISWIMNLLQKLKEKLPTMNLKATGTKKPSVCLFDDMSHGYSATVQQLTKLPTQRTQPLHFTVIIAMYYSLLIEPLK